MEILLNNDADPNELDVLARAAAQEYEMTRLLLQKGATVTDRAVNRAHAGGADVVKAVIEYGGNPNAMNDAGYGAMHWSCMGNDIEDVKTFLDAGADPNLVCTGSLNNRPLHMATTSAEMVELLLTSGADPTLANANGVTPLDMAEAEGQEEVIKLLKGQKEIPERASL